MKQFLFLAVLFLAVDSAKAQDVARLPKWMSSQGFWVVESTKKNPKNSTIYFYNNDKALIYKETMTKKINVSRISVCKRLEAVLLESLTAWNKEKILKQDQQLVASRF